MSGAAPPNYETLIAALAELSPSKVEKLVTALGVPKRIIEESRINHPQDIYRVKSDALSWWIANVKTSWEAVATALEATGVDERNLAEQIRSSHGISDPDSKKITSVHPPPIPSCKL